MRLWPHLGFASRVGGLCCRGRTESGKKNELPVPLPALTSLWLVPISSCLVILADSDLFPAIGQESNVPLGLGAVPCQGGRKGTKGSWESPQPTVVEEKQRNRAPKPKQGSGNVSKNRSLRLFQIRSGSTNPALAFCHVGADQLVDLDLFH